MSYCVNCGVELDKTAPRCPLCGIETVHPGSPVDTVSPTPHPTERQPLPPSNRRYMARLLAILLSLPVLVCFVTDLAIPTATSWSVYPIGAIVLFWILVAGPLLPARSMPVLLIAVDAVSVLAYLLLIALVSGRTPESGLHWYLSLALPIVLVVALAVLIPVIVLRRYKSSGLHAAALLFIDLGLAIMAIETVVSFFVGDGIRLSWSWIVLISCLAVSVALLVIERSPRLLEEMQRRLHI